MKITLEYPYNEKWKSGYIQINPEGRKTLILFNNSKDRTSTQYARYLLAVKLGRFLTEDETVDHINGNKQDDSLENLQILSRKDNISKTCKKPDIELVCPICGKHFTRTATQLRGKKQKALEGKLCCSRKCGYKKTSLTLKGRLKAVIHSSRGARLISEK